MYILVRFFMFTFRSFKLVLVGEYSFRLMKMPIDKYSHARYMFCVPLQESMDRKVAISRFRRRPRRKNSQLTSRSILMMLA